MLISKIAAFIFLSVVFESVFGQTLIKTGGNVVKGGGDGKVVIDTGKNTVNNVGQDSQDNKHDSFDDLLGSSGSRRRDSLDDLLGSSGGRRRDPLDDLLGSSGGRRRDPLDDLLGSSGDRRRDPLDDLLGSSGDRRRDPLDDLDRRDDRRNQRNTRNNRYQRIIRSLIRGELSRSEIDDLIDELGGKRKGVNKLIDLLGGGRKGRDKLTQILERAEKRRPNRPSTSDRNTKIKTGENVVTGVDGDVAISTGKNTVDNKDRSDPSHPLDDEDDDLFGKPSDKKPDTSNVETGKNVVKDATGDVKIKTGENVVLNSWEKSILSKPKNKEVPKYILIPIVEGKMTIVYPDGTVVTKDVVKKHIDGAWNKKHHKTGVLDVDRRKRKPSNSVLDVDEP